MPWTWEEIKAERLGGPSGLAYEPGVVVAEFERVESHFGRAWMEADRTTGGVQSTGLGPTLGIVATGTLLAGLDGVARAAPLVAGLRERNEESMTEALAIHLLRTQAGTEIEYEPSFLVHGRPRKPDLRARLGDCPWVYAEVAKPNDSEMKQALTAVMRNLAAQVQELSGSFAAEAFLRRRPSAAEIAHVRSVLSQLSQVQSASEVELPDGLGKLVVNTTEPGNVVVDYHGEGYRPGIGMAICVVAGDERRHLMVRIAYSDDRAEQFLRQEARQLPTDAPGIVMLYVGRATGALHSWASVMEHHFQPAKHTRVGAVCLFEAGFASTAAGEVWRPTGQLLINPYARIPVPEWVRETLISATGGTPNV